MLLLHFNIFFIPFKFTLHLVSHVIIKNWWTHSWKCGKKTFIVIVVISRGKVKEDRRPSVGNVEITFPGFKLLPTYSRWDSRMRLDRVCVLAYIRYPSNYRLSEFPSWAILLHFTYMRRRFPWEKSIFRVRRYILTVSMSSVTISKRLPFHRATSPQGPKSGRVIPLNHYVSLAVVSGPDIVN